MRKLARLTLTVLIIGGLAACGDDSRTPTEDEDPIRTVLAQAVGALSPGQYFMFNGSAVDGPYDLDAGPYPEGSAQVRVIFSKMVERINAVVEGTDNVQTAMHPNCELALPAPQGDQDDFLDCILSLDTCGEVRIIWRPSQRTIEAWCYE